MIAVLSVRSEVKLLVAFTSLLLYLSLPLVGCHSLHEAKMTAGRGAKQSSIISVGLAEPILVSEKKPCSWPEVLRIQPCTLNK